MKNKSILLCLLAAVLVVAGCSKLTPDNFAKVETGMTSAEVKKILGSPTNRKDSSTLGITTATWTYKSGKTEAELIFVNDKLVNKAGSF